MNASTAPKMMPCTTSETILLRHRKAGHLEAPAILQRATGLICIRHSFNHLIPVLAYKRKGMSEDMPS